MNSPSSIVAKPSWSHQRWRYFVDTILDPVIDRVAGIETTGYITAENLGLDRNEAFDYRAAGWRSLQAILKRGDVTPDDVFVDFGCGKGRVLYLAGFYPFKEIIGVDLSRAVVAQAQRNLRKLRQVRVEVANAADWPIPDDLTFAFFHNPFPNVIFERVIENVMGSLTRRPRRFRVIYRRPHRMHSYLLEHGFTLIRRSESGPTNLYSGRDL
jgi:SAM-dependent methyltransferase